MKTTPIPAKTHDYKKKDNNMRQPNNTSTILITERSQSAKTGEHIESPEVSDAMDDSGTLLDTLAEAFNHEVDSGASFEGSSNARSVELVAEKVVATAFARSLFGYPATDLMIDEAVGICKGTGMAIPAVAAVEIGIAGFLWEHLESSESFDELVTSNSTELDEARKIIGRLYYARHGQHCPLNGGQNTLVYRLLGTFLLGQAITIPPHIEFIKRVGRLLAKKGHMSAGWFAFWCRDYMRRLEKIDTLNGAIQQPAA